MQKTRIMDRVLEVSIAVGIGTAVSVLAGIRSDLNDLSRKLSVIVEKVSAHDENIRDNHAQLGQLRDHVTEIDVRLAGSKLLRK